MGYAVTNTLLRVTDFDKQTWIPLWQTVFFESTLTGPISLDDAGTSHQTNILSFFLRH